MGLFQLIEIGRRSLSASNAAINTTGQNIANAENESYSRRRVTMKSDGLRADVQLMSGAATSVLGLGVSVASYDRMRDTLLLGQAWEAEAGIGSGDEEARLVQALEGLLPASGRGSVNQLLGDFWGSWSDLADNPTDNSTRLAVRNRASNLTATLNRLAGDLQRMSEETTQALAAGVDDVNSLLNRIADLNGPTVASRANGLPDFAAEDERDALVSELAAYGPVRVEQNANTGYTVKLNNIVVVEGDTVNELALDTSGDTPAIAFGSLGLTFEPPPENDGRLGALLRTVRDTIPDTQGRLDALASALVENVNSLHSAGYGADGGTGRAFFDPAGTTAASIRLNDAIRTSEKAIAHTADPAAQGDSSVALAIADLRTATLLDGGTETAESFATGISSNLGSIVEGAKSRQANARSARDYLQSLERGVSGVNMDEELSNLIRFQQSYAASARILNTAQSMFDTLLAM